jgi:hypothetical protein
MQRSEMHLLAENAPSFFADLGKPLKSQQMRPPPSAPGV